MGNQTSAEPGSRGTEAKGPAGRAAGAAAGGWGAVAGILPHLLHHFGLLAGASLISGMGGRIVFGAVGLLAVAPLLLRVYRRFDTWVAPATSVAIFALLFFLSSFVLGPALRGDDDGRGSKAPSQHPGHDDMRH